MGSFFTSRHPLASVLKAGVAWSLALGAMLVTSVVSAPPAAAHAVLIKLTPAANSTLSRAPTRVVLEFDEPVNTAFATVVVINPVGVSVARGKAVVTGAKVTQALNPKMASGVYRVAYQVTSDDGHPVSGDSKFTVRLAAGTEPTTSTEASPSAQSAPVTAAPLSAGHNAVRESWLTRFLVPIAGTVGLIIIGAGLVLWERRRR